MQTHATCNSTTLAACLVGLLALPCFAQQPIQLRFSDAEPIAAEPVIQSQPQVNYNFADAISGPARTYPKYVNTEPGHPRKPLIDRPGDRDRSHCPPERYCLPDNERAGNPQQVAWWAQYAINKDYSACYVGGGTAWILPWLVRPRHRHQEGTWGLDYDGLFKPRRVWLRWSGVRDQGGVGQYEADYEPRLVSLLKEKSSLADH